MGRPRLLVSTFTAAVLAAGFVIPAATAREGATSLDQQYDDPRDPATVARAMFADPNQVVSAELAPDDPTLDQTDPRAVMSLGQGLVGFPTNGTDFGMISTGDTDLANDPNDDQSISTVLDGLNTNAGEDLAGLVISFNAPAGANCLNADVKMLSDEFPEFVGSAFNDFAAGNMNNATAPSVSGPDPSLADNFLFDGSVPPNELEINTSQLVSAEAASGTTYDGATPTLLTQTGVSPGLPNTLRLWVGDVGDSHFDTTVFVDNIRVFAKSPCPVQTRGPSVVKGIRAKVSRGRATVRGTVLPAVPGGKVFLAFFANSSPLRRIAKKTDTLNSQSEFRKRFRVPFDSTRCMVKVNFTGDAAHFPSAGKKKFRC
jgi:hypothetical protein